MLRNLQLNNFAVVSEAELACADGMTAISGETGAGKSLLVDALLLLTGVRADATVVRHGAERAELSAEFSLDDATVAENWLRENELDDPGAPRVCQIRRTIRADGGSRAWINGRPATLAQLGELGGMLVEIHGQHEHQALLSRSMQTDLLDAFGRHVAELAVVRETATCWRDAQRRMALIGDPAAVAERLEWLDHQLKQFDKISVDITDIEDLLLSHKRQSHAAQLLDGTARALASIQAEEGPALETSLARLRAELQSMGEHDPRFAQAAELVDSATIQLAEAANLIERARDDIEIDPDRLQELEERIAQLHDLARKHRVPMQELTSVRGHLAAERDLLRESGADAARLQTERDAAADAWREAARKLTAARTRTAAKLGAAVGALMGELGMAGGSLRAELEPTGVNDPSPQGAEQIELLVSANPGQPPRPLRKVASGGELSRIALAIEVAALGMDAVPTMVFDEVDAGIGGAVAEVVGRKLRTLGRERQVLCVTHLPQVAAQAHRHVRVSKANDGATTRSAVVALDADARIQEIARMLGGIRITAETTKHARQMLASARED